MNAFVARIWPVVVLSLGIARAAGAAAERYPIGDLARNGAFGNRIVVAPVLFEGSLEAGPTIQVAPADGRPLADTRELPPGARTISALAAQRESVLARVVQEAMRQALSTPSGRDSRIVPVRHAGQAETALGISAQGLWLPPRGDGGRTAPEIDAVNLRSFADRVGAEFVLLARARLPKVLDVTPSPSAAGGVQATLSTGEVVVTVDAVLVRARDGAVLWREQQSARPEPRPERRIHRALRGDAYQSLLDAAARAGSALGMSLRQTR